MPGVPLDGIDKLKTSFKNIFRRRNKPSISQSAPTADTASATANADATTTKPAEADVATSTPAKDAAPGQPLRLTPAVAHEKDGSPAANPPNVTITPPSAKTEGPSDEHVLPLTDKKTETTATTEKTAPAAAPESAPTAAAAATATEASEAPAPATEVKTEDTHAVADKVEADKAAPAVAETQAVTGAAAQPKSETSSTGPVMSATSGPLDDHPQL